MLQYVGSWESRFSFGVAWDFGGKECRYEALAWTLIAGWGVGWGEVGDHQVELGNILHQSWGQSFVG